MTPWQVNVFSVRHLSPMGAWQLRRHLDAVKPKVVLIEGLDDATALLRDMVRKDTVPPIALLAYTDSLPVRTLVYPLAGYSPEYQAIRWAVENKAKVEFIDLPSDIFLAFQDIEEERLLEARRKSREDADESKDGAPATEAEPAGPPAVPGERISLYERIAASAGEADYDSYWERQFEHNGRDDGYRRAAFELGKSLRELEEDAPRRRAELLVREAYMRRRIAQTIEAGTPPAKIVAVVGAFHAPVIAG